MTRASSNPVRLRWYSSPIAAQAGGSSASLRSALTAGSVRSADRAQWRRRGSVDVALAALPVRGAQLLLEDLAARVARQGVQPLDAGRALEPGQVLAGVVDDRLLGQRRAVRVGGAHDHRLRRLPPAVVG